MWCCVLITNAVGMMRFDSLLGGHEMIDPTEVQRCQKWHWSRHLAPWLYEGQGQSWMTDSEWRVKPIHLPWLLENISMQPLEFKCCFVYLIFKMCFHGVYSLFSQTLCTQKTFLSLFCFLAWNAFPLFSLPVGNLLIFFPHPIEFIF